MKVQMCLDIHPTHLQSDKRELVLGASRRPLNTYRVRHRQGFGHHHGVSNGKRQEYRNTNQTGRKAEIGLMRVALGGTFFVLPKVIVKYS